ncbi:MAG: hypothetical protein M3151_00435 [Actinomycetota bacterium]|nr:hypothetical protein [Actinomycetota bacterium]
MGRILYAGGTVVTTGGRYGVDVFAEGEKVAAVGTNLDADASGALVTPGSGRFVGLSFTATEGLEVLV